MIHQAGPRSKQDQNLGLHFLHAESLWFRVQGLGSWPKTSNMCKSRKVSVGPCALVSHNPTQVKSPTPYTLNQILSG